MSSPNATVALNGNPALEGSTLRTPRYGIWTAMLILANQAAVSRGDAATVTFLDQTYTGTVIDAGVYDAKGWARVVGGAGGWGKLVPAKGYQASLGVKLSTVLQDAANDTGESLGTFADRIVGPAYVRPPSGLSDGNAAEGSRILDALATEAWYVDESGKTQIGVRTASSWQGTYRLLDERPDLEFIYIAPDTVVGLVPGAELEGLTAASVRLELTEDGVRAQVWGERGHSPSDRGLQALERIIDRKLKAAKFYGRWAYQITGSSSGTLNLRPVLQSTGMPTINNVPYRVGIFGGGGTPAVGSTCLLSFINGDPTQPFADAFEGPAGANPTPTEADIYAQVVKLGDATATALARADHVNAELGKLQTAHNTHVHVLAISAASGTGGTGTAAPPVITYTPSDVSASKVMGT